MWAAVPRWLIVLAVVVQVALATGVRAHPGQHDQLQQVNHRLEQAPEDQELYIQRGIIYSEGGRYEAALADFQRAQALGDPLVVNFQLGVLHYRMGEHERARDDLQRYLQRFPDYPPAYDYLARIERDSGNPDAALAHLERYFALQSQPTPGHYLAAANMLAEGGRIEQALAVIDRGQDRLGVIPQLQRRGIELERARGHWPQALSRLQSLGPVLGQSPAWQLDMAELLLQAGRGEEAAAMVGEASAALTQQRPTPVRITQLQRAAALETELERWYGRTGGDSAPDPRSPAGIPPATSDRSPGG